MIKKGFYLRRAVSLLLVAVMIVTAAPQTSLTVLAAEQGMIMNDPDISEDLGTLTTEDGTSMEAGDTALSESEDTAGQDDTDDEGDIGDESAEAPSDDGAEVGSDEPTASPEEDMDNDLTTDDESVSGNDLMEENSVSGNDLEDGNSISVNDLGEELNYKGELIDGTIEDGENAGTSYLRLRIDEAAAAEENNSKDITPILEYYKEKGQKFNCIELNMIDESPSTRVVKKDYINGALSIMDTENEEIGCWIDYNFWNEQTQTGVAFSLSSPYEAGADIKAAFTLTDLKDQGLKVKFVSTAFPAESVSMSYDLPGKKYADSLPINDGSFRLFTHSSGTPKAMVSTDKEQGWGYYATGGEGDDTWTNVYFNNIKPLGTMEYLAASIYEDEESPIVGSPVQLQAGRRAGVSASSATSVTWMPFDTDKATIDKSGKLTAWSDQGEIYYYVKYKVGTAQYLEVHEMHAQNQPVEIYFDEDDVTIEMGDDPEDPVRKYLRLRFKPSDAERQVKWEITNKQVIDFVYYDNNGNKIEWDGNGELPDGVAPNGEIKALSPGKETVKATYLDDEGNEICTATCNVKVVKPLTWEDMQEQIDAMNLYAVMDLDTKLSDVALGEGWKWEAPDTLLANFKGSNEGQFPAVYTDENGKTLNTSLCVRFVTVTGVEIESKNENKQEGSDEPDWFDWVPDSIKKGEKVTLGCSYRMDNLNGDSPEIWQAEYDAVKERMEANYQIVWTSSLANALKEVDDGYQFTAPASITKAQKYTFTVSVKDKKNKVYLKNSCAITVTLNSLFDWDLVEGPWTDSDESEQMWLNYNVKMTKADYEKKPLTIASEDTAILKLIGKAEITQEPGEAAGESDGEGTETCTHVRIRCSNLKPGTAWIKLTAQDEVKSFRRDHLEFIDKEPKLNVSAVTINQALADKSAEVTVRTHMQYPIDTGKVMLQLNGKDTSDITASVSDPTLVGSEEDIENSYYDYNVNLALKENAASVKIGKNTVTLRLVVTPTESADTKAVPETYSLNLTVNVVNTVPKVTFKQAKKVNLFYNDIEGYGVLNVTGTNIKELNLTGCGFEVKSNVEPGVYYIALKANGDEKSKRGKLSYQIEGYSDSFETAFTVSTETKKPTIVLSQKSDTLYPVAGYRNSCLRMSDKATGEDIVPDTVTYVDKKNKINQPLSIQDNVDWENSADGWNITGKTDYYLIASRQDGIVFRLQDKEEYKKKTDSFSLEIIKENWKEPIAVSYSIKVDTAKPKLALGKATLTLNKNSAVYRAQQERTSLHLKGAAESVYQDEWNWVSFEGQDETSKKILKKDNSLVLKYESDPGDIIVNFNDNSMAVGTYKFKVNVGNNDDGLTASTVLTVKIVDISIEKTLKVTAKGSIDVMNREETSIAYTPKISNISGEVVEGRLEGKDSDLFDNWWEDGKLIIKARGDITYSTKHTYQVCAVFEVETRDYGNLMVSTGTAKPLTIKVKQSKPRLTASIAGNTIYRQLDNAVEIKLSAMLNNREVEISDVQLLNYTEDFELKPVSWIDEEGNEHTDEIYNTETKSVRLGLRDKNEAHNITKSGTTWKVKLAVRYCEQAGNEKLAEVTCPIVVR